MAEEKRSTIAEIEDGSLLAKGITSMRGEDGHEIELKPVMALCRCGHSKRKPFCDNSHKEFGFRSRGGTPAGRDRIISYEGAEVTVTFNPRLCSHAAECARIAENIFDARVRPWIQPDNGTLDEVDAVIAACPSGALAIADAPHRIADRAQIQIQKDGPYWVTGPILSADTPGEGSTVEKYVLCRCGLSGNKPYCDGSHRDAKWRSDD